MKGPKTIRSSIVFRVPVGFIRPTESVLGSTLESG